MRGRIGGVHVKVKQVYENAHYVHCAAHQLNLILSKAASCNKEAKLFFAKLDQIPSYFSKSPDRRSAVELNIPSGSKTRWNYNSKTVLRVSLNRQELLTGFNIFVDNPERFGFSTIAAAENCIRALNDDDFNFWLKLFSEIMPAVEILYNVMQCTDLTVQKVEQHLQNFQDAVNSIRNSSSTNNVKKSLSSLAKEVCDSISFNITERFKFSGHLRISQLFLTKYFTAYKSCFPIDLMETVKECYPVIEIKQLQRELKAFYTRKDMHQDGLVKILLYFEEHNLTNTFNETAKLLRILITIPMTSVEAERTFSTLKRIKTYLRNTMGQSRLNCLSVISIGRDLLKNCTNFKEEVMEKFINQKERRMNFTYKGEK